MMNLLLFLVGVIVITMLIIRFMRWVAKGYTHDELIASYKEILKETEREKR